MSSSTRVPVVLLDCGSAFVRAGYADEDGPRLRYPSIIGFPRNRGVVMAAGMHEFEIGEEAIAKRGMLNCRSPIKNGVVTSWEDMERLWSHLLFSQMRIIPEEHCFVITQPVNADIKQKEKTLELMMETFNVHSVFLGVSPVFSLYSYGKTTGLVVDGGHDSTSAVPVFEGYALGRHVSSSKVAGAALTNYLAKLLRSEGYSFSTAAEMHVVNAAKESLCCARKSRFPPNVRPASSILRGIHPSVSKTGTAADPAGGNYAADNVASANRNRLDATAAVEGPSSFFLPDGQEIPLESERHMCPEALFNFSILADAFEDASYASTSKVMTELGEEFHPSFDRGASWLPFAAISNCEADLRPTLYNNVVLAGGGMSIPGTRERMQDELIQLYRETHANESIEPISVDDIGAARQYSAFLGGAMLSRTSMFPHLTVSKNEYEEQGARAAHCKYL